MIPLLSRIIAVADAYNAMTSDRPYREAMPSRVARMRLAQAVETQFDTAVVGAFEAILRYGIRGISNGAVRRHCRRAGTRLRVGICGYVSGRSVAGVKPRRLRSRARSQFREDVLNVNLGRRL